MVAGLDPTIIAALSKDQAIGRVRTDLRSDFIFAPQYKLVFYLVSDDLWSTLVKQLRDGTYTPAMLITSEVPKASGLTRPGSILYPLDRVLFQAIGDYLALQLDSQLDDTRVYSYRVLAPDPDSQMYQPRSESYGRFKVALDRMSNGAGFTHAIDTDIASYFIHINHHTLENLLTASGMPGGLISLLVKTMLETWSGKFSYGIPQGMFPSDLIGNYYLVALDTFLASHAIPSVRYVDDIVMFFPSGDSANAFLAPLCRFLRGIGLDLNESKTRIVLSTELAQEQSELDRLFQRAREDILEQLQQGDTGAPYGFQDPWAELGDDEPMSEEAELLALQELWGRRTVLTGNRREQLDRFCLAAFGGAGSDAAVETVLRELGRDSHLTRTYCNYLATFVRGSREIQQALCGFIEADRCKYDWELQWPIAALLGVETLSPTTIT